VLRDTYSENMQFKPRDLRVGRVWIIFKGEIGVDAGGLTREWFLDKTGWFSSKGKEET
jgi:hypothetical protein